MTDPPSKKPDTDDDSYLWERSGPIDPEVEDLERTLGALGYQSSASAATWGRAPRLPLPAGRRLLLPLAAAATILAAGGIAWLIVLPRPAPPPGWQVSAISGIATIDASPLANGGELRVGQWLETGAEALAQVQVADIGTVTVHPGSRLGLLATRSDREHRLQLDRGRIEAMILAPPRLFFVNTPWAVAVDLGCAYRLEVDDSGRGLLEVTFGWVAFEREGRESVVPTGGVCQTRPQIGPGTPYFAQASEPMKQALQAFDFEDGGDEALQTVLAEARPQDTLTLWHLLSRVAADRIEAVFDRLCELTSPPAGITREGILGLDETMLRRWWDALEPIWLE